MKRSLLLLLAVLMLACILACTLAGCFPQGRNAFGAQANEHKFFGTSRGEGGRNYHNQHFIFLGFLDSVPWFNEHALAFTNACDTLGVDGEIMSIPDLDAAGYMRLFETALTKKPDGIICFGMPEIAPLIRKAKEKYDIPCVIIDRPYTEELFVKSEALCFVGTPDQSAGRAGARHVLKTLDKDELKVGFLLVKGDSGYEQRMLGYMSVFEDNPGIEVAATGYIGYSDSLAATATATAILMEHPDIDVMISCTFTGGAAISAAMKKLGMPPGSIMVMGYGSDMDTLELCKEGYITATIAQKTGVMHFYALQVLISYLNQPGQATADDQAAGFIYAPQTVDTGVTIITQDTAQYYINENDKAN